MCESRLPPRRRMNRGDGIKCSAGTVPFKKRSRRISDKYHFERQRDSGLGHTEENRWPSVVEVQMTEAFISNSHECNGLVGGKKRGLLRVCTPATNALVLSTTWSGVLTTTLLTLPR